MTQRTTVRQLEAEFADAMTRMYAVGNGLARLRAELDREAADPASAPHPPPEATSPRMPSPAVAAPPAGGASAPTPGMPATGPVGPLPASAPRASAPPPPRPVAAGGWG